MTIERVQGEVIAHHDFPVQTVRGSPDGETLLTGDTERNVCLWKRGELLYKLDLHSLNLKVRTVDRLRSIDFSPTGDQFYVASGDCVQCFRTSDGHRMWSFVLPRLFGFLVASPLCVNVSKDGRVAVANDNGTFGYRDAHGRRMRSWKHNAAPRWLKWTPDGNHLIGSDSFSIRLWDAMTGETVRGYRSDERAFNLESHRSLPLFAIRSLHKVQVYDIESSDARQTIGTHEGLPLLAFAKDSPLLAVSHSHGAQVVDVSTGQITFESPMMDDVVLAMTFNHDDNLILGLQDGSVRRIELNSGPAL